MNQTAGQTANDAQQVDFEHIRIKVGDTLQLQLSGEEQRHPVKLIGYVSGKTLLVTAPQNIILREHQNLTLRLFSGTSAFAFNSSVLKSHSAPLPYLHLTYPRIVHKVSVRGSARVDFNFAGTALNLTRPGSTEEEPIVILDLSANGASFSSAAPLGKKDDHLRITFTARIGNIPVSPVMECVIRSLADTDEGRIRYGAQFQPLPLLEMLTLQNLVYQKLLDDQ